MIHYINKPGYYRTFNATSPVYLTEVDVLRTRCFPLVYQLVGRGQRDLLYKLLARHGAGNVKGLHDDKVPMFLAELEAVALALGLRDE